MREKGKVYESVLKSLDLLTTHARVLVLSHLHAIVLLYPFYERIKHLWFVQALLLIQPGNKRILKDLWNNHTVNIKFT